MSSGAMSRAHYALVRKVELAGSASAVDQIVLAEVEVIRGRFARSVSSIVCAKQLWLRTAPSHCDIETDERVPCVATVLLYDCPERGDFESGVCPSTCRQLGRGWRDRSEQANRYRMSF